MYQDSSFLYSGILILVWVFLALRNKLPSIDGIRELVGILNSRGGNILILTALTLTFFHASMRWFYYVMGLLQSKSITPDNAVLIAGISFVTGTAFGSAIGALLSALTGQDGRARTTDKNGAPPIPAVTVPISPESAPIPVPVPAQ